MSARKAKKATRNKFLLPFCRDEATRTPDPYVPNVVRYQLRYIPIAVKRVQRYNVFLKNRKFFPIIFPHRLLLHSFLGISYHLLCLLSFVLWWQK